MLTFADLHHIEHTRDRFAVSRELASLFRMHAAACTAIGRRDLSDRYSRAARYLESRETR